MILQRARPQARRRTAESDAQAPVRIPGLRWIVTGLLVAACGSAAALGTRHLLDPHTLPIRSVRIEGRFAHLTKRQLEDAVMRDVRGGFFTVDVAAVMRAAHALPWVDAVSVRRIWPDTLRIEVTEQQPMARWGERDLLNRRGERYTPAPDSIPAGLPALDGPQGSEAVVTARYFEMRKALAPDGLKIARLMLDERRSWRVDLDNGVGLVLGRNEAYEHLLRFVRIYPRALAAQAEDIETVDLRYTNGLAVRWKRASGATEVRTRGG